MHGSSRLPETHKAFIEVPIGVSRAYTRQVQRSERIGRNANREERKEAEVRKTRHTVQVRKFEVECSKGNVVWP